MTDTPGFRTDIPLAAEISDHVAVYTELFGTGSAERLDALYEPRALVIPRPGHAATGPERVAVNEHLLRFGGSLKARTRHSYVVDDIALLIVDWSIRGASAGGRGFDLSGTATDVARRGPDGKWRYVIDNPYGTASP